MKNAKCSNVIFIPINVNNLQIRQINNTNLIQGVQGIADIELLLINTTNINESLFITALIYHGMNMSRTFNIYLLNVEVNLISNETTISTEMSTSKSTENKLDISSVTTPTPRFMSVVTSPEYNFISDGISFEAFENTLPPLFDELTIGQIEALIYKVEPRDLMEWSDNLSIPTSALYLNLSSQIQYVVTKSVQLANVQISFSFKILNVTFEKVIVQIETVYRVNNTEKYEYRLINSIFMKMTVEMRSLEASLLTDMELKQIFIEGLGKLNVTSGPNLVDIEFTRLPTSMSASTSSLQQKDRSSVSTEFAQPIRTTETVKSTSTVKTTSPSPTTTSDDFGRSILFRQKSRVIRIYFHTWSHEI
ncbi:unnamed protein product [Schistosoma curassoni]|uniref:SEA domain-containing protein n=1 Tax=Schistosoma curassoni TaxID=6186 RepID=A0A183KNQ5_9TREM|nr:unnamed protein product [Schistosoma curassoni]